LIFFVFDQPLQNGIEQKKLDLLQENIQSFLKQLSDYESLSTETDKEKKAFLKKAHWFYQKLIAPMHVELEGVEELIIIPDQELALIPFEVFLMKEEDVQQNYTDLAYLIKQYAISYNYSANLFQDFSNQKNNNNGLIFGLAGEYKLEADSNFLALRSTTYRTIRDHLQPLPAAKEEVNWLAKHFKGQFYFDQKATERSFKLEANDYSVIHLAVHGLYNGNSPLLSSLVFH
jgi:CHAT domain-containing protein